LVYQVNLTNVFFISIQNKNSFELVFARLYLVCRFMLFHSHLVRNASSQSLGCLNQVSMNFFFLMKTYLEQWPTRCLIIFCTMVFLIGSWSLRACNYNPTDQHESFLDSMWLFIITFTTVGLCSSDKIVFCFLEK